MQTVPQPVTGYSKGGSIASSATHTWGRCDPDLRFWVVIPADIAEPVTRAVTDDFGTLVAVGAPQ
jgi:hypothetical protein